MNAKELKDKIEEVVKNKESGTMLVYRQIFQDPLLYVSFLNGVPVYAYSFVVKNKWYEGLLEKEEVENNLFGNLFEYAFGKYGEKFVEHLVKYSNMVISKAISEAFENEWQVVVEFEETNPEEIRRSVGIVKAQSELESFVKTLQSLGAKEIYIPKNQKSIGHSKGLVEVYEFLKDKFSGDVILSTPFANVFLIYKNNDPVLVSTESALLEEDFFRFVGFMKTSSAREISRDENLSFPIFSQYGRPFLISFWKGEDFLVGHIRGDKIVMTERKNSKRLYSTILEYNEKISLVLYEILGKETQLRSQELMDMRIRILMMKYSNPEDLKKAVESEKF